MPFHISTGAVDELRLELKMPDHWVSNSIYRRDGTTKLGSSEPADRLRHRSSELTMGLGLKVDSIHRAHLDH